MLYTNRSADWAKYRTRQRKGLGKGRGRGTRNLFQHPSSVNVVYNAQESMFHIQRDTGDFRDITYLLSAPACDDALPKGFCSLLGTAEFAILVRYALTRQPKTEPNRKSISQSPCISLCGECITIGKNADGLRVSTASYDIVQECGGCERIRMRLVSAVRKTNCKCFRLLAKLISLAAPAAR